MRLPVSLPDPRLSPNKRARPWGTRHSTVRCHERLWLRPGLASKIVPSMVAGLAEPFAPGDVISYIEMCQAEGCSLQRGMNFRLNPSYSVILMSTRPGAPYTDRIEDNGRVLIYEGHDVNKIIGGPDPKLVDQPESLPSGKSTQNGLFLAAAAAYKQGKRPAEPVKVYEKIKDGIWAFTGNFELIDAFRRRSENRYVFKFRLHLSNATLSGTRLQLTNTDNDRVVPSSVKIEVWKRDKGRCCVCGSDKDLHFDHVIPYSKGGSSRDSKNIQILCAKHNLAKSDEIQ